MSDSYDEKLKKIAAITSLAITAAGEAAWIAWVFGAGGATAGDLPLVAVFAISGGVVLFIASWAVFGVIRWVLKRSDHGND